MIDVVVNGVDRCVIWLGNATPGGQHQGIWLSDLDRGVFSRLTSYGITPVPSPDNMQVVFTSDHAGGIRDLYVISRQRGNAEATLLRTSENKIADDWTGDGRYIVYVSTSPKTKQDLWLLPTFAERTPVPFLATPFNEIQGQVSPDGKWIAYASDETGTWEVYVQSPGEKQIVSAGGGAQPQWRADGRELFYLATDRTLTAVDVKDATALQIGRPKALFRTAVTDIFEGRNRFAATRDGQKFLVDSVDTSDQPQIAMLINWYQSAAR